jgi:iron complex transport system substrate-binding protein
MRIVSLLPSATEIVCALGAHASLVGVSHECDHPPAVRGLPVVTRAQLDAAATSAVIDRRVRDLTARGLSIYDLDLARLRALAPDVIVTQDQCDVCAIPLAEVEAAAREVLGAGVTIVALSPVTLADIWLDVERVAAALGRVAAGAALVAAAKERLAALAGRTAAFGRPVVACIEWLDPVMLAGNWIPDLVAIAGGAYPFLEAGQRSITTSWAALEAARPDVVVVMPCGFDVAQTRREIGHVTARPEWRALPAVQAGRAHLVDGNAYLNRPGPRIVESAEILAGLVHPETSAAGIPPGAIATP